MHDFRSGDEKRKASFQITADLLHEPNGGRVAKGHDERNEKASNVDHNTGDWTLEQEVHDTDDHGKTGKDPNCGRQNDGPVGEFRKGIDKQSGEEGGQCT